MASIEMKSVALHFRLYHDKSMSLKEWLIDRCSFSGKKAYEDFWALKNINLTINNGDRIGIIGHNGAGKSSLLKIIAGIYPPMRGSIETKGRIAPLLEIGAGFNLELTGRENIYLNGAVLGMKKSDLQKLEADIISFCELEKFIDTPVKYYSSGMYMRLAFSIATAIDPEILILDELFAGGDASFINKATERMTSFIDKAKILVFVSHQMGLVEQFCNKVVWLDHGEIVEIGEPTVVIGKYNEKFGA